VVSTGHPRREIDEFAKLASVFGEWLQRTYQTPVVVNNTGLSDDPPATRWAGPFLWLAKHVQRITIWATVKVIVKSCSHDGKSVNMFELRDRLASTIDDGVVSHLQGHFTRLALLVILSASLFSVVLAFGIRQLPL
jgi:hypothetical protein